MEQLLLRLVDADKNYDYIEADKISTSMENVTVCDESCDIFHRLLLLKYQYKNDIGETSKRVGVFITKREAEIVKLLEELNDADL